MSKQIEAEPDLSSKRLQVITELYKEQCAHGRHTETQRHAASAMFLAFAGALMAVIGAMKFAWQAAPLAVCLIFLGSYARRFIGVYERKWDELSFRRAHYRKLMQGETGLQPIDETIDPAARNRGLPRLRDYWKQTFRGVSIAGFACLLVICVVYFNPPS